MGIDPCPSRLPDPIERGEASVEDWYWDSRMGDRHVCGCGRLFRLSEGETISPDPYAIPVCPACFEQWLEEVKGE